MADGVGEYNNLEAHADKSKEIGKDLFKNLVVLHEEFSKMSEKDAEKERKFHNKYSGKEAKEQINNVLLEIATKGGLGDDVKWPKEEPTIEAAVEDPMMMAMGDGAMAENMEGGMMVEAEGMEGTAFLNPAEFGDSNGPTKFPKLMLECMAMNPYFYDLV